MTELSLYVLDIVQNSISAGAKHIEVLLEQAEGVLTFSVKDDGCGMSPEFLENVLDPFTTTRTTRKVGLGLPFLKQLAEQTGGDLRIESKVGTGTTLTTTFGAEHIDMPPMGDLTGTITTLIQGAPHIWFTIVRALDGRRYTLDTQEMKAVLGEDVPLNAPDVLAWLGGYLSENELELSNPSGDESPQ